MAQQPPLDLNTSSRCRNGMRLSAPERRKKIMTKSIRIGLIGDYNPEVKAHIAIPRAVALASHTKAIEAETSWLPTPLLESLAEQELSTYDAFWCVPASPYVSMDGALRGIRFAREHEYPFLGTCGGFQHMVIEYVRN